MTALDQALAQDPKNAWALDSKGAALFQLGRFDEAVTALDQALALDPKNAWALASKGEALRMLGRFDEAVTALDQALALDPKNAWALASKGEALLMLGRFDEAVTALDQALALDPKNAGALASKGLALLQLDHFDEAVTAGQVKQRLMFSDAQSAGWAAFRLASYQAADTEFLLMEAERLDLEALALKNNRPTSSDAIEVRFNLALTMLCSKRFGLALSEYGGTLRLAGEKQPRVQRGLVGPSRWIPRTRMDVHQRGNLRFPQSLPEFQRLFPDDAACAAYLEKARWSDGFVCPHCQAAGEPFRFANRPGVLRCRQVPP